MRYGYRRVHVLLRREGWAVNVKRVYRLYKEMGLQLRNKTPKRRVKAKLREDRSDGDPLNEIWAMDFVHDQLATGRKMRILTIVDTFSRFSPAVDPRFSYPRRGCCSTCWSGSAGKSAIPTVDPGRPGQRVHLPRSRSVGLQNGVVLDFSRPGKPTDNAFIEILQRQVPGGMPEPALVHEP